MAGDFFAAVPEGADAYPLKQLLHDWPDEPATAIRRSCRAAMRPDSRLLILDRTLSERVGPTISSVDLLSVSEALAPFD